MLILAKFSLGESVSLFKVSLKWTVSSTQSLFGKYQFVCLWVFGIVCVFVLRLFVEILNSCMDCDEIQFKEDGSWAPMRSKKEVQEVSAASYNNGLDGETYDGLETERLLLHEGSERSLGVIKLGLKRHGKKRENVHPLPSLFMHCQF